MIAGAIEGSNLLLLGNGKEVGDLRALRTDNGAIVSAWMPTPAELAALNRGSPVYLFVWSEQFPPVYVGVKDES